MKRLLIYLTLVLLLFVGCRPATPVPNDSLSILSGVVDNVLYFDGQEGSEKVFAISSKLPWEVLSTPGVTYEPASGEAATKVSITARAKSANNTLQTKKLGDIVIRLASTRFTGLEAHQKPQIVLPEETLEGVAVPAEQNSAVTIDFECHTSDFEVVTEGDVYCKLAANKTSTNKYTLTVSATRDNMTTDEHTAGYISFKVAGVLQQGKVAVVQSPAFTFDSSRIVVNGKQGSEVSFKVNTPFDFVVSTTSTAMSVVKGDDNMIVVTAKQQNPGTEERKLGEVVLSLADNSSCKATVEVWQRKVLADKTLLFFMLGTSLKGYYETNLKMVEQFVADGKFSDNRVIAFVQQSSYSGSIFEIYYDAGRGKVLRQTLAECAMPAQYDEQMLYTIFSTMLSFAPAMEYGMFVGSHGKGWLPKVDNRAGMAMKTMALDDYIWTPAPGAVMVRHLGGNPTTQVDTFEVASALKRTGCHLSYMIFDVCYMGNVESAYDLREVTDYILASPCEVMASGMPYNEILPYIADSSLSVKNRLDNSAKAFVDYYNKTQSGIYCSACSVVINCSELEALAQSVKRANGSLQQVNHDLIQAYDGISSSRNPTHIFFDIEDYLIQSCTDEAAVTAFKEQLSKTISGQYHTTTFYSAYNNRANAINYYSGLTTSAPITLISASAYIEEWKETEWYKATH